MLFLISVKKGGAKGRTFIMVVDKIIFGFFYLETLTKFENQEDFCKFCTSSRLTPFESR